MTVLLDGGSLTVDDLVAVAAGNEAVALAPGAEERMAAHRRVVLQALAAGGPVYGLTTGVAERKRVLVEPAGQAAFNRALLHNHRLSQGPPAPRRLVRATMLVLANSFASGVCGVRPELAQLLVSALHEGVTPEMRMLGSVGQADLGPLADLANWLVEWSGYELGENEGLALIDGNAFSTACSALALGEAQTILAWLESAAALDYEAFAANVSALHPVVGRTRRSAGVTAAVTSMRAALAGSVLFEPGIARNLQDPLTFRCVPQLHGAARDALAFVSGVVSAELNSSQGNPVVALDEGIVVSVGNFDPVAMSSALDFARIALAPVLSAAAERTVKLLQAPSSGLTAGLADRPETGDDGLAELAVASQSFAAEARLLAQPVSFELVSTSKAEGIEDRTTMAPLSARRLHEMVTLACRLVAVELVVAAKAVDLRRLGRLGRGTQATFDVVRRYVPGRGDGPSPFPHDLDPLVAAIRDGALTAADPPASA